MMIDNLKYNEGRVSNLLNKRTKLYDEFAKKYIKISSNPRFGGKGLIENAEEFFAAHQDETFNQRWLDAMFDTHDPFAANVLKMYNHQMFAKAEEVASKTSEWSRRIADAEKNGIKVNQDFEMKNSMGLPTGKFISKYDYDNYMKSFFEAKTALDNVRDEHGEESKEYRKALSEYRMWKLENSQQQYDDSYYKILWGLSPDIAEITHEHNMLKSKYLMDNGLTSKDSMHYDATRLSKDDHKYLGDLKRQRDEKIEAIGKTDEYHKWIEQVSKLSDNVISHKFHADFEDAKNKDLFLLRNTTPTTEWYERQQEILEAMAKVSGENADNDKIQSLLKPYKDEKGVPQVHLIPDDVLKEIDKLRYTKKEWEGSQSDAARLGDLGRQYRKLVDYIPSEYYYEELERQKGLLKGDEKIEDTDWYKQNHIKDKNVEGGQKPKFYWMKSFPREREITFPQGKINHGQFLRIDSNYVSERKVKDDLVNKQYEENEKGYALPKDKWISKEYQSMLQDSSTKGKATLEFHKYLTSLMDELTSHVKDTIYKDHMIPAISNEQKSAWEQIKSHMMINDSKNPAFADRTDTDPNGNVTYHVPFRYNKLLHPLELQQIDDSMSYEQKAKIRAENAQAREDNKAANAAAMSHDIKTTMKMLIQSALNHKYKSEIEGEIQLALEKLKNDKFKVQNGLGQTLLDKFAPNEMKEKAVVTSGERANLVRHMEDWVRMEFYEDREMDEGRVQSIVRKLMNFTSLNKLALSPLSALNNVVYGQIMVNIERHAGQFMSGEAYNKGRAEYTKGMLSYYADLNKEVASSKVSAILRKFNIVQQHSNVVNPDDKTGKPIDDFMHKALMKTSALYFGIYAGEHYLQNSVLLGEMHDSKIIDGKIVNWQKFRDAKLEKIDTTMEPKLAREAMARNKASEKLAKEEFDKLESLYDSFDFKDGEVKLKDGIKLDENELADFSAKVTGDNQYMRGIYDAADAGAVQKYALGRAAMQFRKYLRPGWNARFGSRMGETFWNERRGMKDEGRWVTTAKFLAKPILDNMKRVKENPEIQTLDAAKNIMNDYYNFMTNVDVHWHSLDSDEKANVKRTVAGFAYFAGVIAMGKLLVNIASKKLNEQTGTTSMDIMMYQQDRLVTELLEYSPAGWFNFGSEVLKSPAATYSTIKNIAYLTKEGLSYINPFGGDHQHIFKGGIYSGDNKMKVYASKLIPLRSQYQQLEGLHKNNKFFKLFQ